MRVVITGGIATGKSLASSFFKKNGYEVIDADSIAHKELDESKDQIVKLFGDEFVKDEKVDRKKLGKVVFEDAKKREILEKFLHPKIRKSIEKEIKRVKKEGKKFILDIPLYFETKNRYNADLVLLIYAPKELQLKRLIQRDRLSKDEALKRIEAQMDIEKKRELADIVIQNTKDIKEFEREIKKVIGKIDADFKI